MIETESFKALKDIYVRNNKKEPTHVAMNSFTARDFIESGRKDPSIISRKANLPERLLAFVRRRKADDRICSLYGLKTVIREDMMDGGVELYRADME